MTALCSSGVHCGHCRDLAAGGDFRRGLKVLLKLDQDDFECPFGQAWGAPPEVAAPVRTMEQVSEVVAEHCSGCEHAVVGPADAAWPDGMPGCRLIQNCLNRPCFSKFTSAMVNGAGCPAGRFLVAKIPNDTLTSAN